MNISEIDEINLINSRLPDAKFSTDDLGHHFEFTGKQCNLSIIRYHGSTAFIRLSFSTEDTRLSKGFPIASIELLGEVMSLAEKLIDSPLTLSSFQNFITEAYRALNIQM